MAKILIVDDERVLVKGIKFNLEHEGYQVQDAYDGEEAVELAREGGFDQTEDLPRLLSTLERERLGCRRILPLCPCAGEAAKRVLVLARKDAAAQCRLEAPLPLHDGQCWSRGALAFCPWLGAGHEEKR